MVWAKRSFFNYVDLLGSIPNLSWFFLPFFLLAAESGSAGTTAVKE